MPLIIIIPYNFSFRIWYFDSFVHVQRFCMIIKGSAVAKIIDV